MINWTEEELKERLRENKFLRVNQKYSQVPKEQKRNPAPSKKQGAGPESKYRNKKTQVEGIIFDSKKEAEEYQRLTMLKRVGIVIELELQPKFILQPAFDKNGIHYRAIIYKADFRAKFNDGHTEIIDTKGFRTKEFNIKLKLFEYRFPDLKLILK